MRVTTIICLMLISIGCNFASDRKQGNRKKTSSAKALRVADSLEKDIPPYKKFKEFNGDTLNYITYNFIDRKKAYENKPLDSFLKDLELPILKFYTNAGYPPDHIYIRSITFKLERDIDMLNKFDRKAVPNLIIVNLESSLTHEEEKPVLVKSKLGFTPEAKSFYGKEIVKDISVTHYSKGEPSDSKKLTELKQH